MPQNPNKISQFWQELKRRKVVRVITVYAARGEKDRAYENLRIFNRRDRMPGWVVLDLKNLQLFNSIRDEPEFQQILHDVESKYQAEHERVRQWLEENDML